jgi:potassium-transporting ATPase potassium-binding subunit
VTLLGWLQIVVFFAVVVAITPRLGAYMARVYTGERVLLARVLGPFERGIYRLIRADVEREQDWKSYAASVLLFSLAGWVLLYLILRTQTGHPFNPQGFHSAPWNVRSTPSPRSSPTRTGSTTAARRR